MFINCSCNNNDKLSLQPRRFPQFHDVMKVYSKCKIRPEFKSKMKDLYLINGVDSSSKQ